MDHDQALEIVRLLTDGIDPTTGEELPAGSPLQQPQIIRALAMALRLLQAEAARAARRARLPEQTGQPWSAEEDRRLVEGYEANRDLATLALAHRRTKGAVRTRLLMLGKFAPAAGAAP
jgi:hypothetical protein